jgi:hypothetical protein
MKLITLFRMGAMSATGVGQADPFPALVQTGRFRSERSGKIQNKNESHNRAARTSKS